MTRILQTDRLILREITVDDAAFMIGLLNQPSFIKYIGDRGVRDLDGAREFIENKYRQSYREHGYGLYMIELKDAGMTPIGMCGFVRRDTLPAPDIGFALLPQFEGKGYAFESASAVMEYGRDTLGFDRVLAITTTDNESSGKLLTKLGFKLNGPAEIGNETLNLYSYNY